MKCSFVCLKARHISKICLNQIEFYKCSKQNRVAICHFEKIDSNTQVSANHTFSNDDSTKEEPNVNFNSPLNTDLLETVIATVENGNVQCKV